MINEVTKGVIYPYGKVEIQDDVFAFKYLFGGVLVSDRDLELPNETIIMGPSHGLSEALAGCKAYTPRFPLGDLTGAVITVSNMDLEFELSSGMTPVKP